MTTYPKPSDPVSALTRADGTTEAHSTDHGRVIGIWENVKHHGAKADGTSDDAAAFTAAIAAISATRGGVYVPPGNYKLASAVAIPDWVKVKGFGRNQTNVNFTNTHAFTIAASTGNQWISDLTFTSLAGSTSGSAIKVASGSSATIDQIAVNGVSTNTDPGVWMYGAVNCHLDRIAVSGGGGPGIKLEIGAFFANANTIHRSRVASISGTTTPAIYVEGTQNRIRDCVLESDAGYGVQLVNASVCMIEGVWFEAVGNHNVFCADGGTMLVSHCNFADSGPGLAVAGARYIKITNSLGSAHAESHAITFNSFVDPAATNIEIGSNVEDTIILGNRNLTDSTVTNSGTRTVQLFNRDSSNVLSNRFSGTFDAPFRMVPAAAAAASGGVTTSAQSAFSVEDSTTSNWFMVGTRGIPIFRTGTISAITGSDELQTNSFAFYWDQAAGVIKARIRDNSGSYSTANVT